MKAIIVGLGVQGHKRRKFAGSDFVASVDPINKEAEYRSVEDVPLNNYDAALVCIPDEPKVEVLPICSPTASTCWSKSRFGRGTTGRSVRSSSRA